MCEKCVRKELLRKFAEVEYKLSNFIKFVDDLPDEDWKDKDIQFQMIRIRELTDIVSRMK